MSFQDPDHQQRQSAAAAAKQAMLQKFRADPKTPKSPGGTPPGWP